MSSQPSNHSSVAEELRKKQSVLLAGMMLLDKEHILSPGTIRFFAKAYPVFLRELEASATVMADEAGISTPAATTHIASLVEAGYLERINYRKWKLRTEKIEQMNRGDFNAKDQ